MRLKSFLIENVIFRIGDIILDSNILQNLKTHRSYTHLTELELYELQRQKLLLLLKHCTTSCEGYNPYKKEIDDPFEWIKIFPILTKKEIVNNGDLYLSNKFTKEKLIKYESSGSSGLRSVVYIDKNEQSSFRAILINWWEWNGYYLGKPILQTGITPIRGWVKSFKDILLSTTYIDAFKLSENEILTVLTKFQNKKGYVLIGFASSLYIMAKVARENRLKVHFDFALSFGDKLFEHYKKEIVEVFSTNILEDYGCNEGIMIGQKKDLPYFYIYVPSVYLEILDENDKPVPDGTIGRVIATKLDGYAMPLIRYDTGDLAVKLPKEKYPVKRDLNFPLLEKVIGRNTDIIKTPEGNNLIVHVFTGIFEFFPEIMQFQVIQDQMDSITIKYIPSLTFKSNVLPKIGKIIQEKADSNIRINWLSVDKIEPSASGKPQIIVNNLLKKSLTDFTD